MLVDRAVAKMIRKAHIERGGVSVKYHKTWLAFLCRAKAANACRPTEMMVRFKMGEEVAFYVSLYLF